MKTACFVTAAVVGLFKAFGIEIFPNALSFAEVPLCVGLIAAGFVLPQKAAK